MTSFSKVMLMLTFVAAIGLVGCGQKGNLYLPSQQAASFSAK
jgi:predicted small lipoprotein YifL